MLQRGVCQLVMDRGEPLCTRIISNEAARGAACPRAKSPAPTEGFGWAEPKVKDPAEPVSSILSRAEYGAAARLLKGSWHVQTLHY